MNYDTASFRFDKYLETYTLEEILELNDLTETEALGLLIEAGAIQLPLKPVDIDD